MEIDLQKLKEIYLTDVDSESYQDNLDQITRWEKELVHSENMISWQSHDTTLEIKRHAKQTYVELAKTLATNRKLSEEERISIYARQDACLWLITLGDEDPTQTIAAIKSDIQMALQAV